MYYKIMSYLKKNKILYNILLPIICLKRMIVYIGRYLKYVIFFNVRQLLRRNFWIFEKKYNEIFKYKDIHKGKRCFILATGPSLLVSDIEMIKDEFTFSVNTIYKAFEFTKWRPDYYLIQDKEVYKKYKIAIDAIDAEAKFYGDTLPWSKTTNNIVFPLNLKGMTDNYQTLWFSTDCHNEIADGGTVVYSAMQLAVYMGFTEIYLLGCDCDYTSQIRHFGTSPKEEGAWHLVLSNDDLAERMFASYKVAHKYAQANNIKIINSTRGGKLEIFPRQKLEDILI